MTLFARFITDESGATSVEYGLIAVCISAAIVVVLQGVAGLLLVIQDAAGQREESAGEAVIQLRKRSLITRGHALQNGFVGQRLHAFFLNSAARRAGVSRQRPRLQPVKGWAGGDV